MDDIPFRSTPLDRTKRVLDRLTYKDWKFHLGVLEGGHLYLQVQFPAPSRPGGPVETQKGRKWLLSEHMTTQEIAATALKAVLTAEEHEAREQFLYLGKAIFGPHLSLTTLWASAGDLDVRPGVPAKETI